MNAENINTVIIKEDEMYEIDIPLDSEKENVIIITQSEPDLS